VSLRTDVYLPDVVGNGYGTFWGFRGRYRCVKGSRASKKSKTAALWFIYSLMKYPGANLLVVRKVFRTLKDSCFTELKWAINRFGVAANWEVKESPLEMTYKPTGQKIYFRGLDDPLKITSITVERGSLCWGWIEECYEVLKEDDFNMLDESIRGDVPDGLWKMWTLTFNPWNERHWLKRRFFDVNEGETVIREMPNGIIKRFANEHGESVDTLALTTNYTMNEWLDGQDLAQFERMKRQNPRRYRVAGLGDWGIVEGVIYENWREEAFELDKIKRIPGIQSAFGLDWGYTNDPSALWCGMVDAKGKRIWVFDELYKEGMSNEAIYAAICEKGYRKERIRADSAEPKSIDRLRELGLTNIQAARKGKDSVNHGIDFIQDFEIIVHPDCVNFITEISNYTWSEDKFGQRLNVPIDDFNHLQDAMRYACENFSKGHSFSFD
jgi:phage terminase large subunit